MTKGPIAEGLSPLVDIAGNDRYRPPMQEVRGIAWNIGGMVTRSSFKIERLVAVTRGGMTITECLSRALDIKDIQTLAIELYTPNPQEAGDPEVVGNGINVYQRPDLPDEGEGTLFGEDVLDTGTTLNYVRENWPKAAIAVAYTKHPHHDTLDLVDFYGKYVGDIWVDFPWEVEVQERQTLRSDNDGLVL